MVTAMKIFLYKEKLNLKHLALKDYMSFIIGWIVSIAAFVFIYYKQPLFIDSIKESVIIYLIIFIFLVIIYTCFIFINLWFFSPDSFYLVTAPLKTREIYWYNWLSANSNFIKNFAHIIIPLLFFAYFSNMIKVNIILIIALSLFLSTLVSW